MFKSADSIVDCCQATVFIIDFMFKVVLGYCSVYSKVRSCFVVVGSCFVEH